MKREITVKVIIDWEDYDDVSDELILEDSGIYDGLKEGVRIEIVNWIPVSEKLPESFITVLTQHEDDLFPVAAFFVEDDYWGRNIEGPEDREENSGEKLLRPPTHWMPLPKPPQTLKH